MEACAIMLPGLQEFQSVGEGLLNCHMFMFNNNNALENFTVNRNFDYTNILKKQT